MDDKQQPIIIKKIKKGGHGHHGGAWKVAYADFVTAMMAFFLLMWLMGGTSHHVREGIADWFKNPTGISGPGGASTSMIKMGGAMDVPRSNKLKKAPSDENKASFQQNSKENTQEGSEKEDKKDDRTPVVNEQEQQEREVDKKRLDKLLKELKKAIENSRTLQDFKEQLLLDVTPQGLRIQIVDKKNRPMFDASSAILKSYTRRILYDLAKIINTVPNHISITGHTDATGFSSRYVYVEYGSFDERRAYSNWELSADRANAARRELVKGGMKPQKIGQVVGLADSILFDKQNPASPINRRISIVVLNRETEIALGLLDGKGGVKPSELKQKLRGRPKS
ncbi:MAG: flagellar motor protein MotB [Thioalkalispiraceae bacterium]